MSMRARRPNFKTQVDALRPYIEGISTSKAEENLGGISTEAPPIPVTDAILSRFDARFDSFDRRSGGWSKAKAEETAETEAGTACITTIYLNSRFLNFRHKLGGWSIARQAEET